MVAGKISREHRRKSQSLTKTSRMPFYLELRAVECGVLVFRKQATKGECGSARNEDSRPPMKITKQERHGCQELLTQVLTYWMSLDLPLNESQLPCL